MRKQYCLLYSILITLFFLSILTATIISQEIRQEQKHKIEYDVCAGINSEYLWRGISASDGVVVQPCLTAGYRNFSMYIWGNLEPGIEEGKKFNEVDVSIGYTKEFKKLTVEPSVLFYFYPGEESSATGEFILRFTHPLYNEFNVFSTHNFDIIKYTGSYFGDAGISYEHWFNDKTGLNSSAAVGWGSKKFNETYNGISKNALNLASFNVSLTYYVSNSFYLAPKAELQVILDKKIDEATETTSLYNLGITIGTEF